MVPKAMLDMVLDQLSMLREQVTKMQETIEKLVEDNRKKDAIIEEKNQIILNANRARFGQSSEQRKYVLSDGQVSMFEIAGDGNIQKETGGTYSPDAYNPNDTGGTQSYGICQWNSGNKNRLAQLKAFTNKWNTLEGQLAFMQHELEDPYFKFTTMKAFGNSEDEAAEVAQR